MRYAGQVKMGYYPTPDALVPVIHSYLAPPVSEDGEPQALNALDPFVGEGRALKGVADFPRVVTYGVELDSARAEQARKLIDYVATCDFQALRATNSSMSLLYYNPPYDWAAPNSEDEAAVRKEVLYLRRSMQYLRADGVLVALIPQLRVGVMARLVATNFSDLRLERFPDPLFSQYRQVVIFGRKKGRPVRDPAVEKRLVELSQLDPAMIPTLSVQSVPAYQIPPTPPVPLFTGGLLTADDRVS